MSVLYLMVPMALMLGAGAVVAFIWAARGGQYDDVDSPAHRMLHDDEPAGRKNGADQQTPGRPPSGHQ